MRHAFFHRINHAGTFVAFALALLFSGPGQARSFPQDVHAEALINPAGAPQGSLDLNGTWLMKDFTKGMGIVKHANLPGNVPKDCIPIQIPGTVRKALLAAGEIPDPYFGYDNEKSLWVEQKEWWFFKSFQVGSQLQGKWIDMVFEGASFQGEVWLNGTRVGELKGMLNPRSFDVSPVLKYGQENTLAVRLEATPDAASNEMARGLTWDTPRDQLYSIAQCMYGWDWGPHGVPIGLWRPVTLRITGPLRIDHPYIRSKIVSTSDAVCTIEMQVQNLGQKQSKGTVDGLILEKDSRRKTAEFHQQITLAPGENRTVTFDVKVHDPKLWWPNGMGAQNLYLLEATVSDGTTPSEHLTSQFGIRELKLIANENIEEFLKSMKDHTGSPYVMGKVVGSYPWTFQVNGKKMFAKGGNWIPVDQLLQLDRDRYDRLLTLAKDAHFNLLRVWGGGLYETDDFYDLCDQYGILAWQEFLSNRNFSKIDHENFLDGAASAVYRLRNHPSLTFWCGGNEFDPDDTGSKTVIDALGALLKKLDPQREFHRASPYQGDDHYWGVWHGQQPYTAYRVVRPFRSEAGVNTFPVPENYRKFTPDSLLWPPDTTFIEFHGEYNTRFQHLVKLERYANEFGPSSSTDEFIRKSELYQALANSFNTEFCRENKFRNSGVLIWQYNDIWPCVSWSLVDWYGTPKPSYYYQKRASRPVHISADYERYLWKTGETFTADVHLLNDAYTPVRECTFTALLLDCAGKVLSKNTGPAQTEANTSATIGRISFPIPSEMAGKTFFVSVELFGKDGKEISSALYPIAVSSDGNVQEYSNIFAELNHMPKVDLKVEPLHPALQVETTGRSTGAIRVSNPSGELAFFVRLRLVEESSTVRSSYSDNYVSLLPGESKTISFTIEELSPGIAPGRMHFEVSGWNCPPQTVEMGTAGGK